MKRYIIAFILLCALALTMTSCGGNADQGTPSAVSADNGVTQGENKPDTARVYELANGNPLIFYESDVKSLRSELTLYEDGTYTLTRIEEYPGYAFEYRGETVTVDCKTVCYTSGGKYGYCENADGTLKYDEIYITEYSKNIKISVPQDKIDAVVENACGN
ncbi:MAG: hypothetical protein J5760_04675, partial [Clostridia bacterium]|nr:hypothetical protein [Clostridia bacterium]